MLRMAIKKLNIVPHSMAVISAALLLWSTQANNTDLSESSLTNAQPLVQLQSCDENHQTNAIEATTKIAIKEITPNNPWAVLRLF